MPNGNGWKKIGTWTGIIIILGALGGWYATYANSNAKTCLTLESHGTRLTKVEQKVEIQEPTIIKLEQYFQIISPVTWSRATERADSILKAREDSLNNLKDSL